MKTTAWKKAATKEVEKIHNREAWLMAVSRPMVPRIEELTNKKMPKYRISMGFPSRRGLAKKKQVLAECWPVIASSAGIVEIFVSPLHENDMEIAASVCHELIHAIGIKGHKKDFAQVAWQMGLHGKAVATKAGPMFMEFIKPTLKSHGHFPGDEMKIFKGNTDHYKKKGTYLVKLECPSCGMLIRTTRKWLDEIGSPKCNCGTSWFEEAE